MTTSFRLEHDFPNIPLEKFIAHLNDERLNHMIEEGLDFSERRLLKCTKNKDGTKWRFSIKKAGNVPAFIQKVLKGKSISWIEDSQFIEKENCIYWRITPQDSPLKFSGEGVWKLFAHNGGCKRLIEGNITVDIPLVGKLIEGFIAEQMKHTYEIEPAIQNKFYASI